MQPTETQRRIIRNLGNQLARHADAADFDPCAAVAQLRGTAALLVADMNEREAGARVPDQGRDGEALTERRTVPALYKTVEAGR